jgi:hypothetical protein
MSKRPLIEEQWVQVEGQSEPVKVTIDHSRAPDEAEQLKMKKAAAEKRAAAKKMRELNTLRIIRQKQLQSAKRKLKQLQKTL